MTASRRNTCDGIGLCAACQRTPCPIRPAAAPSGAPALGAREEPRVELIDLLAEKATARPWRTMVVKSETRAGPVTFASIEADAPASYLSTVAALGSKEADADFIVALANAWPSIRARLATAEAPRATQREIDVAQACIAIAESVANSAGPQSRTYEAAMRIADAIRALTADATAEPWQCPTGVAHLYEIVLDESCVEAIKRLTADPSGNQPAVVAQAAEYPMRDGSRLTATPRPGELLSVQCGKCGRKAIVGLGWTGEPLRPTDSGAATLRAWRVIAQRLWDTLDSTQQRGFVEEYGLRFFFGMPLSEVVDAALSALPVTETSDG